MNEKISTKVLGHMLYDETVNCTDIYFKVNKVNTLDKQLWAWLHMGFISGIGRCGYTAQERQEVLDEAQRLLKLHDERYEKGEKN